MKMSKQLKTLVLFLALPIIGNAEDCQKSSQCHFVNCPKELRSLVGVWHGREKMNLNDDLLDTEVQMVFSDRACTDDASEANPILVGRQITIIPSGKNNASKTDYKEVVISRETTKKESSDDGNRLMFKLADVQVIENEKKTTLKFPGREMEFQKLTVGQVTHFAGKAWTLTKDGKLIGANNFLMESTYNPSSNKLQQKIFYHGAKGNSSQIEVSVYDVVSEVHSGSLTDKRLTSNNKSASTKSDATELVTNGKIYSEERIMIGNEFEGVLLFKSGEQISAAEFQKRIEKQLQKQNLNIRKPASKLQP